MREPIRPARVTIGDVAIRAGVSKTAVSKVLNRTGSISAATTARILAAADDLHWQPSAPAAALRRARAQTIALILNRDDATEPRVSGTPAELITGIEGVLSRYDYGLLLHVVRGNADDEGRLYRRLAAARRIDGAILIDSRVGDPRFALLESLGLPAVLVGTPEPADAILHLRTDPAPGMEQVIDHLVGLGHRKIGYIGGPQHLVQPSLRRAAFEQTVRSRGLKITGMVTGPYSARFSAEATKKLLRRINRPTAVLFGNDTMALAGITVAHKLGMSVPDDLSVVGYEGLPIAAWTQPALTTVERNVTLRGQVAAELLLRSLGLDLPEPDWSGDEQLLIRDSTGPIR